MSPANPGMDVANPGYKDVQTRASDAFVCSKHDLQALALAKLWD
jgi:hypothetical protein